MRYTILASAWLAIVPFAALAGERLAPPPAVADRPIVDDRYPERRVTFAGGVIGLADLVFAQPAGFRPLTLDLYLPPAANKPPAGGFPLIVHVHGGGWVSGHTRHAGALADFPATLARMTARGYVIASISYRLAGEAPFPAAELDVKTAIRWLRARATSWRIDPARVGIWGGSAGGQLAALAATSCGAAALDPIGPIKPGAIDGEGRPVAANPLAPLAGISDCVQAAATWYGVFDFATLSAQRGGPAGAPGAPPAYLGCKGGDDCATPLAAASPITYVDRRTPPMLLIHGTADRTVPYQQSVEMEGKLRALAVPVDLILIPDVDHSFIGNTPQATREATIKALDATIAFFDRTIGRR